MTIKGLAEFLKNRKVPKEGRDIKVKDPKGGGIPPPLYLRQLRGKRVAIETAGIIYRQNWAATKNVIDGYPFMLRETGWTRPADHEILMTFKKYFRSTVRRIIASGIIPIFIVEGKAPDMKEGTVQKRAETRTSLMDKPNAHVMDVDLNAFKKKLMYAYPPGPLHTQAVIDILQEVDATTVRAKYEGEGVCAFLVNSPPEHPLHCDCALTDDYDIFMYGCKLVIRNLRSVGPEVGFFEVEGYAFRDILFFLGFLPVDDEGKYITVSSEDEKKAEDQFRLMCILCGNDYTNNVRNLGPAKICAMIKKHNIHTYEDACKVEPRFEEIPYYKIMETIDNNREYTILNIASSIPVQTLVDIHGPKA